MDWPYANTQAASESESHGGRGGGLETDGTSIPDDDRPKAADSAGAVITFAWPLAALGVNSPFGERIDPIDGVRRMHAGVDLEGTYGMLIRATADGVVVGNGVHAGHGRQVVIEHAGGFRSVYSHLSQLFLATGDRVKAGQIIGRLGNSGRSTGPHLHFELSRYGEALDPLMLLDQTLTVDGTTSASW
jgi:murein DD-endopeptidase MepM/ murein hydrolase activator NlpD